MQFIIIEIVIRIIKLNDFFNFFLTLYYMIYSNSNEISLVCFTTMSIYIYSLVYYEKDLNC